MSFIAISKVKYPSNLKDKIHAAGKDMIPIARSQSGFLSIAFHQSTDDNETMMYWEWETESDHEACMQSPDWAAVMAQLAELFQSEGVEFSLETYERLA